MAGYLFQWRVNEFDYGIHYNEQLVRQNTSTNVRLINEKQSTSLIFLLSFHRRWNLLKTRFVTQHAFAEAQD